MEIAKFNFLVWRRGRGEGAEGGRRLKSLLTLLNMGSKHTHLHFDQSDFRMTLKWKRANNKKQQTNGNRAIWLVYRTDTNARGFWLVKGTLGWKKRHARELSRNQSIPCFEVILQHDWPIEQCLFHIRVFSGGKTKRPCFDLFIHWLIKPITNTYETIFQGHTKIALTTPCCLNMCRLIPLSSWRNTRTSA